MRFEFTLNGRAHAIEGAPFERLVDRLAEVGLTSVRKSCGVGRCGTCMVLLDGAPVNACLLVLGNLPGRRVVTAEGLGEEADAIVVALGERGAIQCGYCAPGMLVSMAAAAGDPRCVDRGEAELRLEGNLCRCSGYSGFRAVLDDLLGMGFRLKTRSQIV